MTTSPPCAPSTRRSSTSPLAPYVYSFSDIFDGVEDAYDDGIHTNRAGDRLIAQKMLSLIESETSLFAGAVER